MDDLLIDTPGLRVARIAPGAQLLLHCDPDDSPRLTAASGIELSTSMLRASTSDDWHALHLAPDEWLLIGPAAQQDEIKRRFSSAAMVAQSLVEISDRSLMVELSGTAASTLINAACPLDLGLRAFPVGACTRTLFGKTLVMLWRFEREDCFRMQFARSFETYVTALIETAALDLPTATAPA